MTTAIDTRIPKKPTAGGSITVDVDGSPYAGVTTLELDSGPGITLTPSGAPPTVAVEIAADQGLGPVFIIRPGGVAGGNVYTSAADAEAGIAAAGIQGRRWIEWDNTLNGFAPIDMDVGAYTELVKNAVWYQSLFPFQQVQINVPEGVTWTALPSVQTGISPNFQNTATSVFTASGSDPCISVMESGANFQTDPACGTPPIVLPAFTQAFFFLAYQNKLLGTGQGGGVPLIDAQTDSQLIVVMNSFGEVDYDVVQGDGTVSWLFNTHSSIAGEQPNLTTPPGFQVIDPQQAANEYWIDTTQVRDLAKHRYPDVAAALAAGIASGLAAGTAIVVHLPDTAESIPCDVSGGDPNYPVILTGPGPGALVVADLTPNDGLSILMDLTIQDAHTLFGTASYSIDSALRLKNTIDTSGLARCDLTHSGANVTFDFGHADLSNVDLHVSVVADDSDGALVIWRARSSRFFSLIDAGAGVPPFVTCTTPGDMAITWDSEDSEYVIDGASAADGTATAIQLDPSTVSEFSSMDDRMTITGVGTTIDPLILVDSGSPTSFSGQVTNLRINAKNATMGTGTDTWDQYVTPGSLLQEMIEVGGATLVWETPTRTTRITDADSPYQLLPQDRIISADSSGGVIDVTLVDPARCPGRVFSIHRFGTDSNAITLDAGSSGSVIDDGQTSVSLPNGQSEYIVESVQTGATTYEWRTR